MTLLSYFAPMRMTPVATFAAVCRVTAVITHEQFLARSIDQIVGEANAPQIAC
ncbi:MAG: hypothetical protein KF861_13565 [Planctomycetaceae bacterium]|nr:hypothetical protein [Planctomycetaceae bacterium]